MSKMTKILIAIGALAVIAFFAVPPIVSAIRDDDSLEAKLPPASSTTATDRTNPTSSSPSPSLDGSDPTTPNDTTADGTWRAEPGDGAAFFVGYEIEETLRGVDTTATGTTGEYEGSLSVRNDIVDSLTLTVDMTTLRSDETFRDDSIRRGGLETETFPEATFVTTEPTTLAAVPAVGETVTAAVTGELTLHGVTRPITIEVDARWNGDTIDVTGEIPIVLADYDISPPQRSVVSVRDTGKVVFVVQFAR